jgi:Zn-finger nucleic acid-binding protein
MLNCPRDDNSLTFIDNDSWTFSYCKECWGIWIAGKDILTSINKSSEEYLNIILKKWIKIKKKTEAKITCSCNNKLVTIKIQKTFIDICPSCKWTWFDNGELKKIKDSIINEKPSIIKVIKELASIDAMAYEWKIIKFHIISGFIKNLLK